jgi:catechol 2,3-dioxygenase
MATEPVQDVAHLGHVEMLTDRFEESLDFFTRVYGLTASREDGDSAYLRAWDDYEYHSLKLTRAGTTGVGHIAYRGLAAGAGAARRGHRGERLDVLGWVEDDPGHGPAFRFEDPFGHVFELYWETRRAEPGPGRPALKNMASRFHATGACPRRLDHLNLLAEDVTEFRGSWRPASGARDRDDPARQRAHRAGAGSPSTTRPTILPAPKSMAAAWGACTT